MSNAMRSITYDADVKALYIQLSDADVLETVELAGNVYLDLDANGEPVGFEVLNADPALLAMIPALPEAGTLGDLLKPRAA
jgi:uncharacterized protein YuzE